MFEQELSTLIQNHLLRRPVVVVPGDGPRVTINGRSLLLMCSNDYLGLSNHPSLLEAAHRAMDLYGFGSGASRLVSGTSPLHQELEERIACFKGTEAAILFNSGYAANTGIIPALAGERDVILSDSLNHASIIDGCRLSRAAVHIYRHKDRDHLEELLRNNSAARRRLIITDSVFSMDGDIAPLPDLVTLAEEYGALLMVDDAHATGVLGKRGRGSAEHFGLEGRIHIQMGGRQQGRHRLSDQPLPQLYLQYGTAARCLRGLYGGYSNHRAGPVAKGVALEEPGPVCCRPFRPRDLCREFRDAHYPARDRRSGKDPPGRQQAFC